MPCTSSTALSGSSGEVVGGRGEEPVIGGEGVTLAVEALARHRRSRGEKPVVRWADGALELEALARHCCSREEKLGAGTGAVGGGVGGLVARECVTTILGACRCFTE